ncbi:MAG: L,D-transpeptidase, partial [Sciscionella sp.]
FQIGSRVIDRININTHHMKVFKDGKLLRSIPISAGMPGFITRSGIKVIIQKYRHIEMKSSTIGISNPSSPNFYDIPVDYALRVTYSGEFLHAAPWQGGNQGVANVSHGCVGMSTENAIWFFALSKVGDVVDVTGSDRQMTLTNGYGDWTETFAQYQKGSALYHPTTAG